MAVDLLATDLKVTELIVTDLTANDMSVSSEALKTFRSCLLEPPWWGAMVRGRSARAGKANAK